MSSSAPLRRNWFQPGEGIAREVITADIQRYLGPDALVKPGRGSGEYEGVDGYWITAYRALTTEMVNDLKLDSQRWRAEDQQRRGTYTESSTHRSRQYYGPSQPVTPVDYSHASSAYPPQVYRTSAQPSYESTYTHSPPQGYVYSSDGRYVQGPNHAQGPRTQPQYTYAQPAREGEASYYTAPQPDTTRYADYAATSAPANHSMYAPQQSTTQTYYTDGRQTYPQPQTRRH